jgi:hypothetical protein
MRAFLRVGCLAALLVIAASCHTWQMQPAPQPVSGVKPLGDHVRVLTKDGRTLEWYAAVVKGDSVVGFQKSSTGPRDAVAIADVASVQVLRIHGARTAGATAGVSLLVFAIVVTVVVAVALGAIIKSS